MTLVPERAGRIAGLDGLRAYAVLLTFLVHFAGPFAAAHAQVGTGPWPYATLPDAWSRFLHWLSLSYYGVHLFFIVSGYIITRRLVGAFGKLTYGEFLLGRLWRIYPAFLVALAFTLVVGRVVDPGFTPEAGRLAINLFFLNGAGPWLAQSYNAVTWSLFYEWCFYLAIPLPLWWAMRRGVDPARPVAWTFLGVLAATLALEGRYWIYVFFFLCGSMGALRHRAFASALRFVPDVAVLLLFIVVTSSLGTVVPMPSPDAGRVAVSRMAMFDIAFGLMGVALLFKCSFGEGWLNTLAAARLPAFLGRISYSMFLLHAAVVSLYFNTGLKDFFGGGHGLGRLAIDFALCFGASTLLAWVSYLWLERPYLERKKGSE